MRGFWCVLWDYLILTHVGMWGSVGSTRASEQQPDDSVDSGPSQELLQKTWCGGSTWMMNPGDLKSKLPPPLEFGHLCRIWRTHIIHKYKSNMHQHMSVIMCTWKSWVFQRQSNLCSIIPKILLLPEPTSWVVPNLFKNLQDSQEIPRGIWNPLRPSLQAFPWSVALDHTPPLDWKELSAGTPSALPRRDYMHWMRSLAVLERWEHENTPKMKDNLVPMDPSA